jgi:hypothetical protein
LSEKPFLPARRVLWKVLTWWLGLTLLAGVLLIAAIAHAISAFMDSIFH